MPDTTPTSTTRRSFVAAAAAAPLFVPSSAFGANDRLAFGLIATGGRGRYLQQKFLTLGAECVAVCDVYEPNLQAARKLSPQAKPYGDYRELLGQSGMDAVVIASPDHQHWPMLKASLDAKKDVYLEKPLSHSMEESQEMIRAVRAARQVVQVGMQRRSAPALIKAQQLVASGKLGRITMVKPQWHWNVARPLNNTPLPGNLDWKGFLGPAAERPVEPQRFRSWRYFFDYSGGNMTDQGTHLMDVVQWFTKNNPPSSAIAHGYVANMKGSEHPDVFSAIFEFPNLMATWTLNYDNAYQNGWSILFQGDEATLLLDEEGYKLYREPWPKNQEPAEKVDAPVPVEAHIQNFMDCVKSRQEPNCPVEIAAAAVTGPQMANKAWRSGTRIARPS